MAKALTVAALEKVKADPDKRLEIPDGLLTGLYFVVQPTGKKSWAVRYRAHGKPRKLTLGTYPTLDLAKARAVAKEALQRVQKGEDPAAAKQDRKQAADRLDKIVRIFLARYAKPKNRSWKETARTLGLVPDKAKLDTIDDPKSFLAVNEGIVGKWGHRPLGDITRAEIIGWLDAIVDRGAPIVANRTLAALRKVFNWAIQRDLVAANPCDRIKPPAAEQARDRVLTDTELRALWIACGAIGRFGDLFKLLVLTGQRRDEVAGMRWTEIDLTGKTWTIPRERVKTDKAHEVPLSAPALSVLDVLPRIAGGAGYVVTTTGQTPVSGFSKAKHALDARMLAILKEDDERAGLPPWRLHDVRRTVASGMARLGVNLPTIEKILNHTSGSFGGIVGVYQRHEFSNEKRQALEGWGRFVTDLIEGQAAGSSVVALRERV